MQGAGVAMIAGQGRETSRDFAQLVLWRRMMPKRPRDGQRESLRMDACDGGAEPEARVSGCLGVWVHSHGRQATVSTVMLQSIFCRRHDSLVTGALGIRKLSTAVDQDIMGGVCPLHLGLSVIVSTIAFFSRYILSLQP